MRKLTIEMVKDKLGEISPNIEILSNEYVNNTTKLNCRCHKCGNEWGTTWSSLRQGCGCPKCANNVRLTIDKIKEKLYEINKNIEIISDHYKNNQTLLRVRCRIDGHEWNKSWNKLKNGSGCAKCANILKLTLSEVTNELSKISPTLKIISDEYHGSDKKLNVECKTCGHIWDVKWSKLKEGVGCPMCAIDNIGWTKTKWIRKATKSKHFKSFRLYILKCFDPNSGENFYKIGRTFTSISRRYMGHMPYKYEVIRLIESKDGGYIYDLENKLKRLNKDYVVRTSKKFNGHTECFSAIKLVEDYLDRKE